MSGPHRSRPGGGRLSRAIPCLAAVRGPRHRGADGRCATNTRAAGKADLSVCVLLLVCPCSHGAQPLHSVRKPRSSRFVYARRARPVDAGRTLAAASTATRSDLRRSRSSGRLRAGAHPAAPESVLGGGTVLGRRQEYGRRPAPVSDGVAHPGVDECFERPAVMRAEEQDASDRTGMRPAERRPSLIEQLCGAGVFRRSGPSHPDAPHRRHGQAATGDRPSPWSS